MNLEEIKQQRLPYISNKDLSDDFTGKRNRRAFTLDEAAWLDFEYNPLVSDEKKEVFGLETIEGLNDHLRAKLQSAGPLNELTKLILRYGSQGQNIVFFGPDSIDRKTSIATLARNLNLKNKKPQLFVFETEEQITEFSQALTAIQVEEPAPIKAEGEAEPESTTPIQTEQKAFHFILAQNLGDFLSNNEGVLGQLALIVFNNLETIIELRYRETVEKLLKTSPENAQKILLSSKFDSQIREISFEYLEDPVYLTVTQEPIDTKNFQVKAYFCDATQKLSALIGLLKEHNPNFALIYVNTKITAEWLHYKLLGNGFNAEVYTHSLYQKKRASLIERIRSGKIKYCVVTDEVSHGFFTSALTHIFNFDVPESTLDFVHRIGKPGRFAKPSVSYTLVCDDYGANWQKINDDLQNIITINQGLIEDSLLASNIDESDNPFILKRDSYDDRRRGSFDSRRKNLKSFDENSSDSKTPEFGQQSDDRQQGRYNQRPDYKNKPYQQNYNNKPATPVKEGSSLSVLLKRLFQVFFGWLPWFKAKQPPKPFKKEFNRDRPYNGKRDWSKNNNHRRHDNKRSGGGGRDRYNNNRDFNKPKDGDNAQSGGRSGNYGDRPYGGKRGGSGGGHNKGNGRPFKKDFGRRK